MSGRASTATALLVLLAAALRLPTLDAQSLWVDEAATALVLDAGSLGDLLQAIADQESTPPLFYLLTWPLVQAFGDAEWVLRLPSALCGIATVPVLAAVGARLGGPRAGLATGLLAAVNPLLVWFSQEARAYALLVLLVALSLLAALRALERPGAGRLAAWGVVGGLALTTHYFALFVVVGEAVWLAWALRERPRVLLAGGVPLGALALAVLPLALDQREADRAAFIRDEALGKRLAELPKQWLVGYDGPLELVLGVLAGAVALAALWGVRRRFGPWPRALRPLLLVLGASLAVPLLAAVAGEDFVLTRNLLPSLVLVLVAVGLGLSRLERRAGDALLTAAVAVALVTVVGVAVQPAYQREDWRDATRALPTQPAQPGRLVAVLPAAGRFGALHYLELPVARGARPVRTIDVVAVAFRRNGEPTESLPPVPAGAPVPGMVPGERHAGDGWVARRFVAPGPPVVVDPAALAGYLGGALVLGR
ncbi:MAG TPA: glycosyltransferase family 39 protein [Baekduia sp.]|nr:glycosyltransferase family 39 protein [Baekduia sp.]